MRIPSHIVLAFALLIVIGAVWGVLPVAPDIAVCFAVYLGITTRSATEAALIGVLVIGWIADLLAGAPRGLSSLTLGIVCIVYRSAASRLLLRGRLVIAGFALVASLLASVLSAVVRAQFGFPTASLPREVLHIAGTALLTAVIAPVVFKLCRLVDSRFARTQRERDAISEGYVS